MRFLDTPRTWAFALRRAVFYLIALLISVPATAASGTDNQLILDFDNREVRLVGEETATQSLRRKKFSCDLKTDGSLLGFSGSGRVGYIPVFDLLGIRRGGGGFPCVSVRNSDSFKIALGSGVEFQKAIHASISLIVRYSTRITIVAESDGVPVETFEVVSGSYVSGDPDELVCPTSWFHPCTVSLGGDNLQFDALHFTSESPRNGLVGDYSVGGGPLTFTLLPFTPNTEIACGSTVEVDGITVTKLGTNLDPETPCLTEPALVEEVDDDLRLLTASAEVGLEPRFIIESTAPFIASGMPAAEVGNDASTFTADAVDVIQWFGLDETPPVGETFRIGSCRGIAVRNATTNVIEDWIFPPDFDFSPLGPK